MRANAVLARERRQEDWFQIAISDKGDTLQLTVP